MIVRNRTRGTSLATDCRLADTFVSRGVGLLASAPLREGQGLRITRTATITMLFMRFSIDAVFVDATGRVVRAAPGLRPWSPAIGARGARDVLELPVGTIARSRTQAGDEITYEE